jgi:hypothetical protein
MARAADRVDLVAAAHLERDRAAFHLDQVHGELDLHAEERRREVIDLHARADRILAGIEMREQQLATGDLDVAHQHRRGVDTGRFAHEADRAIAIDGDVRRARKPGRQRGLHAPPFARVLAHGVASPRPRDSRDRGGASSWG